MSGNVVSNKTAGSSYNNDVVKYLMEKEKQVQLRFEFPPPSLLDKRMELVKRLINVCQSLKLNLTTSHLAVFVLDVLLNNGILQTEYNVQQILVVSISLASKLEETDFSLFKLGSILDESTLKNFAELEMKLLEFAKFDILAPTAATFLEIYMTAAVESYDVTNSGVCVDELKRIVRQEAEVILNTAVKAFHPYEFLPSVLAASCILTVRHQNGLRGWTPVLNKLSTYTINDLWHCFSILARFTHPRVKSRKRKATESPESGYNSDIITSSDDCKHFLFTL